MQDLLDRADNIIDKWEKDYIRLEKKQKIQPIVFGIGAGLTAGGGTILGMGIANENMSQIITGGSVILGTGLVYCIGKYVFKFW